MPSRIEELEVKVAVGDETIDGNLSVPEDARGVVVFAHGSGRSRHNPRNRYVPRLLFASRLATLLLDLLTEEEEGANTRDLRFNVRLLAQRLIGAAHWLQRSPATQTLRVGYFGVSIGAAAALVAAAQLRQYVGAVVSRGGRPDLAGDALKLVSAPTLLIVGGDDPQVVRSNEHALAQLRSEKRLAIVAGATHLFEEPGALDEVARLAGEWFTQHLAAVPAGR